MITGRSRFNIYLMLLLVCVSVTACRTADESEKLRATVRLHAEGPPNQPGFTTSIVVDRSRPARLNVGTSPVLTEVHLSKARLVETGGGFEIELTFDRQGMLLLEESTASNPGRRIAVFSHFGERGWEEGRWIAAPVVWRRISDGVFSFAPDATRAEAEQIVTGLNNLVKKTSSQYRW